MSYGGGFWTVFSDFLQLQDFLKSLHWFLQQLNFLTYQE